MRINDKQNSLLAKDRKQKVQSIQNDRIPALAGTDILLLSVSTYVTVIKYPGKGHLREKGLTLILKRSI